MMACSSDVDGRSLLLGDFTITCGTPEHTAHVVVAAIVVVGFCIGFPLATGVELYRRYKAGTVDDVATKRRFKFLMQGYRPERAYW